MDRVKAKVLRRKRRKRGIRKRVVGTGQQPRLSVFRSGRQIYAQIIDDTHGRTLAAASSIKLDKGDGMAAAQHVGREVGQKAVEAGIEAVAFDRGGYKYHGRVKALAEAAREAGLKF